jgi:hypothetical protein
LNHESPKWTIRSASATVCESFAPSVFEANDDGGWSSRAMSSPPECLTTSARLSTAAPLGGESRVVVGVYRPGRGHMRPGSSACGFLRVTAHTSSAGCAKLSRFGQLEADRPHRGVPMRRAGPGAGRSMSVGDADARPGQRSQTACDRPRDLLFDQQLDSPFGGDRIL